MTYLSLALLMSTFCVVFINNGLASASVFNSLLFCAKTIIPSLFIYMILSETFLRANALEGLSGLMNKYLKIDKRKSVFISIFILSVLCGAPIGAKLSFGAYKKGNLTKREAVLLSAAANNVSMSFIFGVCSSYESHYKIAFLIQTVTSVISALILSKIMKRENDITPILETETSDFKISDIIKASATAMINVCASIIVFSFCADIIGIYLPSLSTYIKGIFEFSSGVTKLKNGQLPLMTAFLSFGGFSVHSQIMTVWENELKYKYLFIPKLIQALLSFFFCEIFLLLVDNAKVLL